MNTIYYANELYHHGIKGQKWGVRRYQNKDGTRTAAGKKRRHEVEDLSVFTDEELQAKNNRLDKELQYYQKKRKLEREKSGRNQVEEDIDSAKKTLQNVVAMSASVTTLIVLGNKLVPGALNSIGKVGITAAKAARASGNMRALKAFI